MVTEHMILHVTNGSTTDFEQAYAQAKELILSSPGCLGMRLARCHEVATDYLLEITWADIADHLEGFRNSPKFTQWRELLFDFYDPKPVVQHFYTVTEDVNA